MYMQINSKKVKQLREQKCWSQQQLADMAGLSLRTLQRIESKSVASPESVKCLAAVFEIDLESLMPIPQHKEAVPTYDDNPTPSLIINDKHAKLRFYAALISVMAANIFGMFGVFSAYDALKIDSDTFQMLKALVSFSLLLSVAAIVFKGYKQGLISFSNW